MTKDRLATFKASLSIGDKKISYKEPLKKVAGEQKFDYNYMEIEEKAFSATGSGQSKKKAKHTTAMTIAENLRAAAVQKVQNEAEGSSISVELQRGVKAAADVEYPAAYRGSSTNSSVTTPGSHDRSFAESKASTNSSKSGDRKLAQSAHMFHYQHQKQQVLAMERSFCSPYDDGINGNPIGRLQELCIAKRFAPPRYLIASEVGLPHDRIFKMVCIVDVYKETGSGKSKKLAKCQAAIKMIETIKDVPVEQPAVYDEDDEVPNKIFGRHSASKSHKSADGHLKISQVHPAVKNATGEMIESLQSLSIGNKIISYKEVLKKVAGEQKFDYNYMEIEEKPFSGQYHRLLLMYLAPVVFFYGAGESVSGAEEAAALSACSYIKIMTKK